MKRLWRYVGEGRRLMEIDAEEIFMMEAVAVDGFGFGRVVKEIVDPILFTIRYIIVCGSAEAGEIILPSDLIAGIEDSAIRFDIPPDKVNSLPRYCGKITRPIEEEIYEALDLEPYWLEERWIN